MAFFFILLIVPLFIACGWYLLHNTVCVRELLIIVGVQAVVAGISAAICYHTATSDTETLNGRVTSKKREWTSCEHSYRCRCRQSCSGTGKNRSCHEVCDTCYEHSNDWNWNVHTTVGTVTIDRVDRQGIRQPQRWTDVVINEPASVHHTYDNYVKAAPDTLFRHQGVSEKYVNRIPTYPGAIHDYYRSNRFVTVGLTVEDARYWNDDLSELNADLGARKQVNILVVLVKDAGNDYFYALEEAWIGGKKNDVILVVGVDAQRKPQWAQVMAWTTNELFKVKLRDAVMAMPVVERWTVVNALKKNVTAHHQRKPMADFEYLKSSITPTTTSWIVALVVGFIISAGMSYFFHVNEVFPEYRFN